MNPRSFLRMFAVLAAVAMPYAGAYASEALDPAVAQQYIAGVGQETVTLLNNKDMTPAQRNEKFSQLILKHMDFRALGRRVLGTMARASSEDQREEFYKLFAAFFIDTVNDMLHGFYVTGFGVGRARGFPNNEVIVATAIGKGDGSKFEAGWRVASNSGVLKIVDVYVQGTSAAGHFRDKMARSTQRNISGNITRLKSDLKDSRTLQLVLAHMQ